jgi:hypothetical protein
MPAIQRLILPACLCLLSCGAAIAAPPDAQVHSLRRAFHNGEHNAFTDLARFQGRLYLTFRSCPDGHMVFPSASIIILASGDGGQEWQPVHRFSVPQRDTRDPHFLVFQDKLFVYTGTWYCGDGPPKQRDLNEHLGYCAWSEDGSQWHSPVMLEGTYGHYIWRAAAHGGKAYLCGRRKHEFVKIPTPEDDPAVQSALLESDDGLVFRYRGLFQEEHGDETAFLFEEDGALLAVSRSGSGRNAQLVRAASLSEPFERTDLGRYIGGPLLVKWQGHYLVGGRKTIGAARTSLYWLTGGRLEEFAELPSGGDNSYPGFVELGPGRALVSYYSSHERDDAGRPITAIYLAELKLTDN